MKKIKFNELSTEWEKYLNSYSEDNDYLSIYIHVPYCLQRCNYCLYHANILQDRNTLDLYLKKITKQIKKFIFMHGAKVSSMYFGGGTASIFSTKQLKELFDILDYYFDIDKDPENQFVLECHPITLSPEKLDFIYKSCINKMSIGIQSLSEKILKSENRLHLPLMETAKLVLYILNKFRDKNFLLNIDLMADLIGQEPQNLINDFKFFSNLDTPKITIYPFRESNDHSPENEEMLYRARSKFIEPLIKHVDKYDYEDIYDINGDGKYENVSFYQFVLKNWKFNFNRLYADKPGLINNRINSNISFGVDTYSWIRTDYAYGFRDGYYYPLKQFYDEQESIKENINGYHIIGKRKRICS